MKVRIIGPDVHGKFKLADKTRTAYEGRDATFDAVVGSTLWQYGSISSPSPNHLSAVHVCCRISRIHPPNVRTQRAAITMRVHGSVIEIVVTTVISAEARIILLRG